LVNDVTVETTEERVIKRYLYSAFKRNYELGQEFNYEFVVLKEAKANKLEHIIWLKNVRLHPEHVAFETERYEMDLRTYLDKHRDYKKLRGIMFQVVAGLKELHGLGFVHRDLKPENIVLNLGHPAKVALIDFNRSLPITN
jgi:serine/threonine protein kinase